jgi:dTDP-4-dehydrorhamnose reductase
MSSINPFVPTQKILVLGATGMLGNAMFRLFSQSAGFDTQGTARSAASVQHFDEALRPRIHVGVDVEQHDHLVQLFSRVRPDVVINCIGLVKQLAEANDPLAALPINSLLPHRLARLASLVGARLVHVSTDCVFSGRQGSYLETDMPDALDLYGRSKLLGEVDYENAITLRTSIIGHEISSTHSLVGWFLAQQGRVKGYTRAVFSGLPTVELARVIRDHLLPRPDLRGLWHVSAAPITKYDLLKLIKQAYCRSTEIEADDRLVIDRSLDSSRFRSETGWQPKDWSALIDEMKRFA